MFGERDLGFAVVEQVIRIAAVHDVHLVVRVGERVRQTMQIDRIAAEAVRRVEGREVEEAEGASR